MLTSIHTTHFCYVCATSAYVDSADVFMPSLLELDRLSYGHFKPLSHTTGTLVMAEKKPGHVMALGQYYSDNYLTSAYRIPRAIYFSTICTYEEKVLEDLLSILELKVYPVLEKKPVAWHCLKFGAEILMDVESMRPYAQDVVPEFPNFLQNISTELEGWVSAHNLTCPPETGLGTVTVPN